MAELTHHLIAYIVDNLHKRLLKTNLLKLLYLVDLEYYKKKGKQATNFRYFYYKKGPWTSQYDQILSELEGFEIISLKKEKLKKKEGYFIFCRGPRPRFEPTLPADLKGIVDRLLFIFRESPQKDLLRYVYSIEPMKSTKFGETIDFSKILPQSPVDPLIEKTVSEANKEYESTNFPQMLDSWVRGNEVPCPASPTPPIIAFSTSPINADIQSLGSRRISSNRLDSLIRKGISLSDEILKDREDR